MENKKLLEVEKAKRKELARVRTTWFLFVFNFLLVVYLVVQILILAN